MEKKSDQLKDDYRNEDNDLKVLGIGTKIIREERLEKFQDKWLVLLKEKYDVHYNEQLYAYVIKDSSLGLIHFYPKSNKVLICNKSKWEKPGLKFLIKNLLNNK